jgi:hypothetical protein
VCTNQQHPALNPEVEAALKQLLASPEVKAQFHDPAVHAALQEVSRHDSRDCTERAGWADHAPLSPLLLLCLLTQHQAPQHHHRCTPV